jgi:pyruvate/2-oxoacid:ferredoxin oxidoreductase alpha subunit
MTDARIITGNQAAALAARLCEVQVVAAYPITPQSQLAEMLAQQWRAASCGPSTSAWRESTRP